MMQTEAFDSFESIKSRFDLQPRGGEAVPTNGVAPSPARATARVDGATTALDGLVISVPSRYHGEYIRRAAQHGLGIFVEKPVAESPREIGELYDVCHAHDVPLCCGFQRRFDASYVRAANAVRGGTIGRPISAHIFFGDSPGPPLDFLLTGGNIFFDLSVHDVDFIRWALNGEEHIDTVYARGTSSNEQLLMNNVQDNATMMMTTTRGTIITLTMSRNARYGYDQRCEIFGDAGKVHVGNMSETTTVISDAGGDRSSRLHNSYDKRFRDAFANELNAFADALLDGIPWPVTREDAIAVQRVAAAAKQSFETNQVVHLRRGAE
jgi:myo-inositol 2-dehydrogenase / D-chiro-inositol 1-dehydrogenase